MACLSFGEPLDVQCIMASGGWDCYFWRICWALGSYSLDIPFLGRWMERICSMGTNFHSLTFRHIFWEQNTLADLLSKRGTLAHPGYIYFDRLVQGSVTSSGYFIFAWWTAFSPDLLSLEYLILHLCQIFDPLYRGTLLSYAGQILCILINLARPLTSEWSVVYVSE